MDIRKYISSVLAERALSVRQLAIKSGVRRQSIMAFLSGANIHIDNLTKILAAIDTKIELVPIKNKISTSPVVSRFPVDKTKLKRLCDRYGIRKMALFGSVLRKDFKPKSDIDIVIDLERPVSLFELDKIEDDLKKLANTKRKLDITTERSLSRYIRDEVLRECEVLYEKAA